MGDVHDIPLDRLARDDRLVAGARRGCRAASSSTPTAMPIMPGRCSSALGIAAEVDHLHDIFAADLTPKPELHGYRKLLDQFGIDPTQALSWSRTWSATSRPAKQLGMTTVWVDNGSERGSHGYDEAIVDLRVDRCRRMARERFWGTSE